MTQYPPRYLNALPILAIALIILTGLGLLFAIVPGPPGPPGLRDLSADQPKPTTPQTLEVRSPNGSYAIKLIATDHHAIIERHEPSPKNDGVTIVTIIDEGDPRKYYIYPPNFTEEQKQPYTPF